MVFLVYAVISPITCFVTAFCFVYMGSMFRHQFVYIYPAQPDSGGKIWMGFIRILLVCLLVAEITSMCRLLRCHLCRSLQADAKTVVVVVAILCTVIGLLALKKAKIAIPLFIPLLVSIQLLNGHGDTFNLDQRRLIRSYSLLLYHARLSRLCLPVIFNKCTFALPNSCRRMNA